MRVGVGRVVRSSGSRVGWSGLGGVAGGEGDNGNSLNGVVANIGWRTC